MRKEIQNKNKWNTTGVFIPIVILILLVSIPIFIGCKIDPISESKRSNLDNFDMTFKKTGNSANYISVEALYNSQEHKIGDSVRVKGRLRLFPDGGPAYLQDGANTITLDLIAVNVPESYSNREMEVEGRIKDINSQSMILEVTSVSLVSPIGAERPPTRTLEGDKDVVVVMVRFKDIVNTRYTVADMTDMMFATQDSVNSLYYNTSYQKLNITGKVEGWYDLAHDRDYYIDPTDDLKTNFTTLVQEAIDLSDTDIDFDLYKGIIVVINGPWYRGLGTDEWYADTDEESPKKVMAAVVGENPGDPDHVVMGRIAHEVGHQLSLKHVTPGYNNPFALMAKLLPGHLCAWSKMRSFTDWIPSANVQTVEPGAVVTYTVQPLENIPTGGDVYVVKVPITGKLYYMIEVRQHIGYDVHMPDKGVIIYLVNEDRPSPIDLMDSKNVTATLNDAPWDVGESFINWTYGINITIDQELYPGGPFKITIQNDVSANPPDVMINDWGDPPGETPPYETKDIWIDSELNGWDWYRYNDGNPANPIGNGDDPWANHTNRFYAKIYNTGGITAVGAKVNFYVNHPPGIGAWGEWEFINSTTVDIPPEDEMLVSVDWVPDLPEDAGTGVLKMHTCAKVEIEGVAFEANLNNQDAQENINNFEVTTGSGLQNVSTMFKVGNPFAQKKTIFLQILETPPGWKVTLENDTLQMEGHESADVEVLIEPPKDVEPETLYGNAQEFHIRALTIDGPDTPEFMHFVEIGGLSIGLHPVERVKEEDVLFSAGPQVVPLGNNILVNGTIRKMPDFTVAILLTSPTGVVVTNTVKTGADGSFDLEYQPTEPGIWDVQVLSTGNNKFSSVLSTVQYVEVKHDIVPPAINFTPITGWNTDTPIVLESTITDNMRVDTAILYYRLAGERTFNSVQMENPSGGNWSGAIPGDAAKGGDIEYYIWSSDGKNNISTPVYLISLPRIISSIIEGREIRVYTADTRTLNIRNLSENERDTVRGNLPGNKRDIGLFVDIINTGRSRGVFIEMQYNDSDIQGIDPDSLRMYYLNETSDQWLPIEDSGVWRNNNTVWANVTHFTIFAPMGDEVVESFIDEKWPMKKIIIAGIIALVLIIILIAIIIKVRS